MDDPLARKWTERSQSPESWLHTAKMLTACAEAVGESFTKGILTRHSGGLTKDYPPMLFGPVFHLLAGYAFEALLKGILVARQRDAITGKSLPGWLTSHNMIALLQQVGVTLEEDLLKFLRRVNIAVIWSGRYPLPKHQADMDISVYSSADLDWFRDIYERLETLLEDEIRRLGGL
jgi:hypothetical protein